MLVLNKYLREIGIDENNFPFNEISENTRLYKQGKDCDERYVEGAGKDKVGNEGFINAESFNLDNTLSMIIYSQLCYFRDNCADFATPSYFIRFDTDDDKHRGHKKWLKTIDGMILAFKLILTEDCPSETQNKKIKYGMRMFIKYYYCLWW